MAACWIRWAVRTSVIASVVTPAVLAATPAGADDGLGLRGSARYVVPADGQPVRVTATITATNQLAPSGSTVYHWDTLSSWLPAAVTDLSARSGHRLLSVRRVTQGGQSYAQVRLPQRLLHGQSQTVILTYLIPGSSPRSADRARVGLGYAAFDIFSEGDAGQARIEIVSPATMHLDLGLPHTERAAGPNRIATVTGGGPTGLWTQLSLRDTSHTLSEQVSIDAKTVTIEAWPGDTRWLNFQTGTAPKAIAILQELTAQQWPHDRATIAEDASDGPPVVCRSRRGRWCLAATAAGPDPDGALGLRGRGANDDGDWRPGRDGGRRATRCDGGWVDGVGDPRGLRAGDDRTRILPVGNDVRGHQAGGGGIPADREHPQPARCAAAPSRRPGQDGPSATAVAVAIDQARPLDAIDNLDAARDAARRELVAGAALVAGAVVLAGLGGVVAVRRRERRAGSAG